jgi:broad specificity phosphatase PhoE
MRRVLNPVRLVLLLLVLALSASPNRGAAQSGPSKIVLVRHAEIGATPNDEFGPLLNEAGRRRAQTLAAMLRNDGVTLILTSRFRRTRETAQPLAAVLGLAPFIIADDDLDAHLEAHLAALRDVRSGAVLVVGHGDTVPGLIERLGGPHIATLCGTTFDRMFVLTQPPGAPLQLTRSRYGEPTPGGADCP